MRIRTPFSLLVAGLLVACGGGGSGDSTTGARLPTADELRAQEMLAHCGADAVDTLLDTLDVLRIVPGATGLPITLGAIEGETIPFTADLDDDLEDDLSGAFSFVDGDGTPFMPFTQEQLDGGTEALLGLLATLPSGTQMRVSVLPALGIGLANLDLALTFQSGLPTAMDGVVNYAADPCSVMLMLNNVSPLGLVGDVPSLPVVLSIQDGDDVLDGTLTLNGTNVAQADVSLNGGETLELSLDLTTGDVALPAAG